MKAQELDLALAQPVSGLEIAYAPESTAERWLREDSVLAMIRFGTRTTIGADARDVAIGLPPLGPHRVVELWRSELPIERGREGDLHYATDGEVMFGSIVLDEADSLTACAREGYGRMLELTRSAGYPHLVRVWNYFPDINREVDGLERYRAFCVGRYEAFAASGYQERSLAAASAIGTHAPGLLLYFLAARTPGSPVENPRQVSAYRYPKRYSPRHPLFSRAMVKQWSASTHLYVSGTASVVGHLTYHEGDTLEQVGETARNLEAIVHAAGGRFTKLESPSQLGLAKVYLRRAEDLFRVQLEIDRLLGTQLPRTYLLADICRSALLLEIDAFYSEPQPG